MGWGIAKMQLCGIAKTEIWIFSKYSCRDYQDINFNANTFQISLTDIAEP